MGDLGSREDQRTAVALRWITSVLRRRGAAFQVTGGLAARAYGATRPLADIDLYVAPEVFADLPAEIVPFIVRGPEHLRDASWDITFLVLDYGGQRIELGCAEDVRIFDKSRCVWIGQTIDLAASIEREVLGTRVPLMPREALMAYKAILGREVDRRDLADLDRDA